jgi:hypothetical protein
VARLDTHWHANPKVLALGLEGMGLHAWGISYCDAELTDGFIPMGALPQLPGMKQAIKRMIERGRWEVCEGGYQVHDYLHYNRSREQVLTDRAAAVERRQHARRSPDVQANAPPTFALRSPDVRPLPVPGPVPGPDVPTERPGGDPPTPRDLRSDERSSDVRANGGVLQRRRQRKPRAEPDPTPVCCPDFARTHSEHWAYCRNAPAMADT